MKKKKNLQLLIGGIVLLLLIGGYALVKNMAKEETGDEGQEKEMQAAALDTDSMTALSFGEKNSFVKEKDTWYEEGNKSLPVDQEAMSTLLGNLSDIRAQRLLKNVKDLKEYGLDQPSNTIQATEEGGQKTVIHIGDTNSAVSACYVYLNDETDKVYLVDTAFSTAFDTTALKLAKKESFPVISGTSVTSLKVAGADGTFAIQKNESQDGWVATDRDQTQKEADSSLVATALGNLGSLSYGDMAAYEPEDLTPYGLAQPAWTVTVDYELTQEDQAAQKKQLVLFVGAKNESVDYYVKTGDSKGVYSMGAENLDTILEQDLDGLLSKYVSNYSFADLSRLKITDGGQTYVLEAKSEEGQDTSQETEDTAKFQYYCNGEEKDMTEFMDFYNSVSQMQGQQRLEEMPKSPGEPEVRMHFYRSTGQEVKVDYYPYDHNFYLAADDQGNYLLVNKMNVKSMREKLENLAK